MAKIPSFFGDWGNFYRALDRRIGNGSFHHVIHLFFSAPGQTRFRDSASITAEQISRILVCVASGEDLHLALTRGFPGMGGKYSFWGISRHDTSDERQPIPR